MGWPLRVGLGHRLAVQLGQSRLVVERLQMGHAAGHAQPDHAFGFRGKMQRIDDARTRPGPAPGDSPASSCSSSRLGQGGGSQPGDRLTQESAAGIAATDHIREIHGVYLVRLSLMSHS